MLFKITLKLQYISTYIIWYFSHNTHARTRSHTHTHACGSTQKEGRGGWGESCKAERLKSLKSAVVVLFVEASRLKSAVVVLFVEASSLKSAVVVLFVEASSLKSAVVVLFAWRPVV